MRKHTQTLFAAVLPAALFFLLIVPSCKKSTTQPANQLSSSKEITSFSLTRQDGTDFTAAELTVVIQADSIKAIVPIGTDKAHLVSVISITGVSITPQAGIVQDFTAPVTYTVAAEDGTTRNYIVTVQDIAVNIAQTVFFGSQDHNFYALDAQTGTQRWVYGGTGGFNYSNPTYSNGIVYAGSIDNYLYAFDAVTGNVRWRFLAGTTGIESPATVSNGVVFFGDNDDYLYAVDAATGTLKWNYHTGGNVSTSPVIAGGKVFFGSSDGKLYALDESTGQLIWYYQAGAMFNQSGPAIANGVLYAGNRDGKLYAVDAATGTLNWSYDVAPISLESSCATVDNGTVYIGGWYEIGNNTNKGSLYAVNAATGQLVWEALPQTGFSSSPVVANGVLYITADDLKVHAVNAATGAPLWDHQILPNSSHPTVGNGKLYVGGGGNHNFYCYDATTGNELWHYATPNGIMASGALVIDNSGIYHAGSSGAHN